MLSADTRRRTVVLCCELVSEVCPTCQLASADCHVCSQLASVDFILLSAGIDGCPTMLSAALADCPTMLSADTGGMSYYQCCQLAVFLTLEGRVVDLCFSGST